MKNIFLTSFKGLYSMVTNKDGFFCELPLTNKSYFKLYEKPGAWCSDEELDQIVKDLRQVAQEGQEGKPIPEYGVLKGDREDLRNRVISIAYDSKTNEPLGFSAQIYLNLKKESFEETVLHLGLIYISPKAQGKNISYLLAMLPNLLLLLKSGLRKTWVSNVSQIPAVVGLVDKNYSESFPSVKKGASQTFYHKKLADLIMEEHRQAFGVGEDAEFDSEQQIIKNSYTGGSDNMKKKFSETKKHRDPKINDLCQQKLDYDRGDDFLQLAVLGPAGLIDLIQNKRSRQSFIQIGFNLILFGAFACFLPIIRWIITNKNTGLKKVSKTEFIYE